jgi:hypothetical protein
MLIAIERRPDWDDLCDYASQVIFFSLSSFLYLLPLPSPSPLSLPLLSPLCLPLPHFYSHSPSLPSSSFYLSLSALPSLVTRRHVVPGAKALELFHAFQMCAFQKKIKKMCC